MPKNLKDIQNEFQDYLLHENLKIIKEIQSTPTLSARSRLNIYRDSYYLRLLEMIEQDYPVLFFLLCEENFFNLGYAYIDQNPSIFRSIQFFGKKFPNFIKNYLKKNKLSFVDSHAFTQTFKSRADHFGQSWVAELATFECLLADAFDANDEAVITVEEMAAIPFDKWPTMQCIVHPSLHLVKFNWNIVEIWKEIKKEKEQPSRQLNLEKNKCLWMIWRQEYEVKFIHLQKESFYMLAALKNGKKFGEICANLCKWIAKEEVAVYAASLMKKFILDGVISKVIIS